MNGVMGAHALSLVFGGFDSASETDNDVLIVQLSPNLDGVDNEFAPI